MAPRLHFATSVEDVQDTLLRCTRGQLEMLRHSTEVAASGLPVLADAPDWYSGFLEAWSGVATRARIWIVGTTPQMAVTSQSLADFGASYAASYAAMQPLLAELSARPDDQVARAALAAQVASLLAQARANATAVAAFRSQLDDLAGHIAPDRQTLLDGLAAGESSITADLAEVRQFAANVDCLKGKVRSLEDKLLWMKIVAAGGITVSAIALTLVAGEPLGAVTYTGYGVITMGTALAAYGFYQIVALDQDIREAKDQIEIAESKMGVLQTQVAALQVLDKTLGDLSAATATGAALIADVAVVWSTLGSEAAQLQVDLESAEHDLDADAIAALGRDLQAAADHWSQVQPLAAGLASVAFGADPELRSLDGQLVTRG